MRKDLDEGAHDQLVFDRRAQADPLQHDAVLAERVADQREVLLRIHEAGAGVPRLDDVGGDDVEAPIGQRQVVAPVVDADVDVRTVEQIVIDVREMRRGPADAVGQFDDLHVRAGVLADRAGRGAAAHAHDQRRFRRAVQHHGQVTDGAMQPDHRRLIVGLMQAVEVEDVLKLRGAHADGGLRTFVAPELEQQVAVSPIDGDLERIRQIARDQDEGSAKRDRRRPAPQAAGGDQDQHPRHHEHGPESDQRVDAAGSRQQQEPADERAEDRGGDIERVQAPDPPGELNTIDGHHCSRRHAERERKADAHA